MARNGKWLLCLLLVIAVFAGPISVASAEDDPFADHLTFSVAIWEIGTYFSLDDPFNQMMLEKFNISIEPMDVGWADYTTKTKLWAASGSLPDVFVDAIAVKDRTTFHNWIEQGIIRDIPMSADAYPNLAKYYELEEVGQVLTYHGDGKFYAVPRMDVDTADGVCQNSWYLMRKDWREALGMDLPTSNAAFSELMRAFIEKDPGKNGAGNTVGLVPGVRHYPNASHLPSLSLSSGVPWVACGTQWVETQDGFVPYYTLPEFVDYIDTLQNMYRSGAIYKNFSTDKTPEDLFMNGYAGAMAFQWGHYFEVKETFEKATGLSFSDAVEIVTPWANDEGVVYHQTGLPFGETYFSAKTMDDAKTDRFLRILDWCFSDEGELALHSGIEGVDYDIDEAGNAISRHPLAEDGTLITMDKYYPSLGGLGCWSLMAFYPTGQWIEKPWSVAKPPEYRPSWFEELTEIRNREMATTNTVPLRWDIEALVTKTKSVFNVNVSDDIIRMTLSTESAEDAVAAMLKTYEEKGLSRMIQEVNEEAAALGL